MNYGFRKLSTRTKLVAAALALVLAGVSHAQQVGGGATLPSIGYVGKYAATNLQVWGNSTTNTTEPNGVGPDYIVSTSLFGEYQAQSGYPEVSYCLTGSGAGKDILASPITLTVNGVSTSFDVQNTCTKNSVGTVSGFGADLAGVGRSDITQPHFAGADAPLSASDYANYQTGHGDSAYPTQFPAVAGAVAIAFNLTDSLGNEVTSSEANFTDAQVCGILDGTYTNWTQVSSAFTLTDGGSIVSAPINVQYRSDGSGTTFSLSNHLAAVCGQTSAPYFEANQAFTTVVAGFFTSGLPAGNGTTTALWTGSSGNAAVANAIAGTANSVGYVETANALATTPGIQFADVNGLSPITNFGTALSVGATAVVYNEVINSTNNTNGTPALETIANAISGTETAPPTGSECIVLVQPSFYAKPGVKGGLVPTGTYPIVAVSYLLSHAQGVSTADLAYTQGLVNSPYNSNLTGNVTTIGSGTGLAFLTIASGAFSSTAAGNCVNSGD
jgi:phosphate transport system substrate-binding protein